jgi:hypothetical protein
VAHEATATLTLGLTVKMFFSEQCLRHVTVPATTAHGHFDRWRWDLYGVSIRRGSIIQWRGPTSNNRHLTSDTMTAAATRCSSCASGPLRLRWGPLDLLRPSLSRTLLRQKAINLSLRRDKIGSDVIRFTGKWCHAKFTPHNLQQLFADARAYVHSLWNLQM